MPWNVYRSTAFDAMPDDPRFVALLRTMNLPTTLRRPVRLDPGPAGKPGRP